MNADEHEPAPTAVRERLEREEHEAAEAFLREHQPRLEAEKHAVRELGDRIGYGRLMQAAEEVWRDINRERGMPGAEHTVGPCAAVLVPCPNCSDGLDEGESCDWCAGAGRVTHRVAKAIGDLGR